MFLRDFCLKNILPSLGGFISKSKEAYTYLPSSIEKFLSKEESSTEPQSVGFKSVDFKSFSFGVSSMSIVRKNDR